MSKKIHQSPTLVKKKGRTRAPTSILAFELDENSVEYLLGDNMNKLVKCLYDKMKSGCKLLFISRKNNVLTRLEESIGFKIETYLIQERGHNKMKEEVMKMVLAHNTERIEPQASIYIGTLFDQAELKLQKFKFGTVTTPSVYFASLLYGKTLQMNEEHEINTLSLDKHPDSTLDHKDLNNSFESEPSAVKQRHFEKMETEYNASSHKKSFMNEDEHEQNNQQQETMSPKKDSQYGDEDYKKNLKQNNMETELPLKYFTKIKDLNTRISCKLCLRLDDLKTKPGPFDYEKDIKSPRSSPPSPVAAGGEEPFSQLGKRKRNFEEDMFNDYVANIASEPKPTDDNIFTTSYQMNNTPELMLKIKNLNFEVLDEADARPIMKKLKTGEIKGIKDQDTGKNEVILDYKISIPGERATNFQIYATDLQRLEPNCYVNDTLINFYLKLIQDEFLTDAQKSQIYIYNTYLIEKLKGNKEKEDKAAIKDLDFEKVYKSVKKWTKDVDIFEKDFLLFPMHAKGQKHWSLFVVCYPKYFLVKQEPFENPNGDSKKSTDLKKPFILYFDSFGLMDTNIANLIAIYLEYEVMHKKPEIYNEIKTNFNRITENRMLQLVLPLQTNLYDCGLYLLEYAERFMMEPDKILENIEVSRDRLHLFPKCIFKTKRADIADIILNLAKGNRQALEDYQKNKEQRTQAAQDDPEEFDRVGEEEIGEVLQSEYQIALDDFDAITQDRLKIACLSEMNDHKLTENPGKV